jgi:alpha-beta hydrolase superfamily lysophospholipase
MDNATIVSQAVEQSIRSTVGTTVWSRPRSRLWRSPHFRVVNYVAHRMLRVDGVGHAAGLAYRAAGDSAARVVLLVHGYPESSHMWQQALPGLAAAGWRAIAPDLPGYGDSEPDPPGTWERHVEALARFVDELQLGPGGARHA